MLDVLIVGGGPAGAALALALAGSELDFRVLDARAGGELGARDRTLALSHSARLVFERIGLWHALDSVTPILTIDVSQRGRFGMTELRARDLALPALGYVIRYGELQAALDAALSAAGIGIDFATRVESIVAHVDRVAITARTNDVARELGARLVVVADGSGEALPEIHRRRIDYRQQALVGVVDAAQPRKGVAFERFTADGPVALLPYESRYALVWTLTPERGTAMLAADDATFLEALHAHFGDRVGRFTGITGRSAFPLTLQFASRIVATRAVVLGNAAQALHPIAGQGFNLGLRDVATLAEQLLDTAREDIGSQRQLARYEKSRRVDRWAGVVMTHSLVRGFASDHPLLALPRGLGLTLLDSVPPLKRAFARAMLNGLH